MLGTGWSLSDELQKNIFVFFEKVDVGSPWVIGEWEGVCDAGEGIGDFIVELVVSMKGVEVHAQGRIRLLLELWVHGYAGFLYYTTKIFNIFGSNDDGFQRIGVKIEALKK